MGAGNAGLPLRVCVSQWDHGSTKEKTARGSAAPTADHIPGPDRPHLSERGSAVSIMLPPDSQDNNQVAPGWRANDLTPADIAPHLANFATKFARGGPDDCWIWQGYRFNTGYGGLGRSYKSYLLAHRVAWVAASGQALTRNLTIDHLCNEKLCVNPRHLEPVTLRENIRRKNERRGYVIGGSPRRKTKEQRSTPSEATKQKNRERALAYYYANRERILEEQRGKLRPRDGETASCESCGLELRRDGLRRHAKRKHGAV